MRPNVGGNLTVEAGVVRPVREDAPCAANRFQKRAVAGQVDRGLAAVGR